MAAITRSKTLVLCISYIYGSCPNHFSLASSPKHHLPVMFSFLFLSILTMPHFRLLQLSYQQPFVCHDEQIGVGSLHFGTGGQFNALIGGLPGRREQTKRAKNITNLV